jgi:hypothetical protein
MDDFNAWHESVKSALGLPYNDGITTEYTTPIPQKDGIIVAFSDEQYAENLIASDYTTPVIEYPINNEA